MIKFHCTIIPVVVVDSVIKHTRAWFLDRVIYQLVNECNTMNVYVEWHSMCTMW